MKSYKEYKEENVNEAKKLKLPEGIFTVDEDGFNNRLQTYGNLPDGRHVKLNRGECVDCTSYVIVDADSKAKDTGDWRGGEVIRVHGKLAKDIKDTIQKYK